MKAGIKDIINGNSIQDDDDFNLFLNLKKQIYNAKYEFDKTDEQ